MSTTGSRRHGQPALAVYRYLLSPPPRDREGYIQRSAEIFGLVGSTGHASGPHLHLQLQPPTEYPQNQAWFQAFAGKAFRWQDAPTPLEPSGPAPTTRVFSVVPDSRDASSDGLIGFTRGGA